MWLTQYWIIHDKPTISTFTSAEACCGSWKCIRTPHDCLYCSYGLILLTVSIACTLGNGKRVSEKMKDRVELALNTLECVLFPLYAELCGKLLYRVLIFLYICRSSTFLTIVHRWEHMHCRRTGLFNVVDSFLHRLMMTKWCWHKCGKLVEIVPQRSSLQNSSKIEGHPGIQGVWIVHSKLELHSVEHTVYCLGQQPLSIPSSLIHRQTR